MDCRKAVTRGLQQRALRCSRLADDPERGQAPPAPLNTPTPAAATACRRRRRRLRKLAAPKVTPVVLVITYIGALTALSVVALVPIDVYCALSHSDPGPLGTLWSISYWWVGGWVAWWLSARPDGAGA